MIAAVTLNVGSGSQKLSLFQLDRELVQGRQASEPVWEARVDATAPD